MRWSSRELGVEASDALPGLAKLNNLVRSVQTPEFAGITFHEVLARSALNKVPGMSRIPLEYTINPYRGCSHACAYCLSPDTWILLADGRQRRLGEIEVGDEVVGTERIGTERIGAERRYTRTKVLATWRTRKPAHRVTLADGTELIASGDHRFLTDLGWTYVTGTTSGPGRRPHLTPNDRLMGFGRGAAGGPSRSEGHEHRLGRLAGMIRGDGTMPRREYPRGAAVKSAATLEVVGIEPLGESIEMVDITTGSGDFLANGVVSHNCFARPTHTYLDLDGGEDFDRQIVVKVNVGEVLRKELARPSWQRHPVALGTNTDPYQRAEGRYRLMPQIIAELAASGTPFSILTKGTLLRRDLPVLADAAASVPVDLAMSIAVYDDELQQSVEPGTPTTAARLATVTAAREAGFDCTVFLMPILPFLTDTIAHLDDALRRAKAAGATSVVHSALHLKPGVKEWFYLWLGREHPELLPRYRAMYRGTYAPKEYRDWLAARIAPLVRAHGLDRARTSAATGGVLSSASPEPTLF